MKFKFYYSFLLLFLLIQCSNNDHGKSSSSILLDKHVGPIKITKNNLHLQYEAEYRIMDSLSADFNLDGKEDYVIILQHHKEDSLAQLSQPANRPVLIYMSYNDSLLYLNVRNNRILYPINSLQNNHDSYLGLQKSGPFIQFQHTWKNQLKYEQIVSFQYNLNAQNWYLHKDIIKSEDQNQPDKYSITQKEIMGTPFESYDINTF